MSTSAAPVSIGDVIGGRYLIEALLGQGGMAVVYRAKHTATGRPCALKLVHPHLVSRRELVDLFVREAQVGARIGQNPHIVDVFDAGVDEARRVPFLAMELLQGETLEDYIEQRGPVPPALIRILVEHLADALDQAHRAGVVHRDLKPSNLFLTSDRKGQPILKVMDFGIAKILESEAQRTATSVGTPSYAAPEQMGPTLRRVAEKQGVTIAAGVSPATDVWALGLLVFELFTGLPSGHFWGVETLAELPTKVALEEPEPATHRAGDRGSLLPYGFDGWFFRCVRRNAAERYPSAGQAAADLFQLMDASMGAAATGSIAAPLTPALAGMTPAPAVTGAAWTPSGSTPAPRPVTNLGQAATVVGGPPSPGPTQQSAGMAPPAMGLQATPYPQAPPYPQGTPPPQATPYPPAAAVQGYAPVQYANVTQTPPGIGQTAGPPPQKGRLGITLVAGIGAFVVMMAAGWFGYGAYHRSSLKTACETTGNKCEESCNAGDIPSCTKQGLRLFHGRGSTPKSESSAAALFKHACDAGDVRACAELGTFYHRGLGGIPRDLIQAANLFKHACDGESAPGCGSLAEMTEHGQGGLPKDEARAAQLYQQACTGHDARACQRLGVMLQRGLGGLPRDEAHAAQLFKESCDAADLAGCTSLGELYDRGAGGLPKDPAHAIELLRKSCDGHSYDACKDLGAIFEAGRGVPKDDVKAAAFYQQACDGGTMLGCNDLAVMVEGGRGGLARDATRAANLYKQACDGHALLSCTNYGAMCEDGRGVPKDEAKAAALFKQSCDGGETGGCRNLGDLYRSGQGVPKDEAKAVELYRSACDKGDNYACSGLGWFYENGKGGLPKDERQALEIYKKACDAGDGLGCNNYGVFAEGGRGGIPKDERVAATYYEKGCDDDYAASCSTLGWFVFQGRGGQKKDRDRGIALLRKGCSGGNEWGCDRLRASGVKP